MERAMMKYDADRSRTLSVSLMLVKLLHEWVLLVKVDHFCSEFRCAKSIFFLRDDEVRRRQEPGALGLVPQRN